MSMQKYEVLLLQRWAIGYFALDDDKLSEVWMMKGWLAYTEIILPGAITYDVVLHNQLAVAWSNSLYILKKLTAKSIFLAQRDCKCLS